MIHHACVEAFALEIAVAALGAEHAAQTLSGAACTQVAVLLAVVQLAVDAPVVVAQLVAAVYVPVAEVVPPDDALAHDKLAADILLAVCYCLRNDFHAVW